MVWCGAATKVQLNKVEPLIVSVSVLNVRIVDCFNTFVAEVSTLGTLKVCFFVLGFFSRLCFVFLLLFVKYALLLLLSVILFLCFCLLRFRVTHAKVGNNVCLVLTLDG